MAAISEGDIRIGEMDFRWSIFRQPTWTSGRTDSPVLLGLAILVEPAGRSCRELLLEFDIDRSRHGDMPQHQRFRIPAGRLVEAVGSAMQAGYDPESRGKRFVFAAGTLQPR